LSQHEGAGAVADLTSESDVRDVVRVGAAGSDDATLVGGKARTLSELTRAGFSVPAAVVLTTAACARVAAAGGEAPPDLRTAIAAAIASLNHTGRRADGGRLAVRSSAVGEDAAIASYAGQYRTLLNVPGDDLDQVCRAIADVVASSSSERVAAYRRSVGEGSAADTAQIAVLLQRQVDADVAGVAFTADPVTGDRGAVVISAVRGLGDQLVDGVVSGEQWKVRDGVADRLGPAPEPVLGVRQAVVVAELARSVAKRAGVPQDIEWAIEGDVVQLLQARPITALPTPPTDELPDGDWVKETGRRADLITRFGASEALPLVSGALSAAFAEAGSLVERVDMRSVGGEVYLRILPVGGHAGPPPPWPVLGLLARVAPPLRARCRAAREALWPGVAEGLIERWNARWRPEITATADRLRALDVTAMSNADLDAHLAAAIELLRRGLELHFRLVPPYAIAVHSLVTACRDLLGWDTAQTLELLTGLSAATSEPTRELAAVAELVGDTVAVRAVLSAPGADVRRRLRDVDELAAAAFDAWCDRYAVRVLGEDPGATTLAEQPAMLAGLLDAELARAESPATVNKDRELAVERARSALAGEPPEVRQRFETALAAAERVYPTREDTAVWAACHPAGLVRRALVEAGRRFARSRALDRADDVVYLDVEAVRAALAGDLDGLRGRVSRARSEQAWVAAHPGPAFIGKPPARTPDVRGLPRPARLVNQALLWTQSQQHSKPAPRGAAGALRGVPAAPGRHTGPVRVVRHFAQFDQVRPGDVVVCPATDPSWSVLFGVVGAIVTEGGGALSHAAIVAREHAVPAVLAVGGATDALHDGQLVTVDGTAGTVVLAVVGDNNRS
jgi:pyruvate,water dikinase